MIALALLSVVTAYYWLYMIMTSQPQWNGSMKMVFDRALLLISFIRQGNTQIRIGLERTRRIPVVDNLEWSGDETCDGGIYNLESYQYDGGDCIDFLGLIDECKRLP